MILYDMVDAGFTCSSAIVCNGDKIAIESTDQQSFVFTINSVYIMVNFLLKCLW